MPPPITPSPHRFLSSSASGQQKGNAPPPSSFRTQQSSSQQFASVPRFSLSSGTKIQHVQPGSSSPLVSRTRHRLPPYSHDDNIDEEDDEHQLSLPLDEDLETENVVLPSIEDATADDFLLPPPKRRRLTPSPPPNQLPHQVSRAQSDSLQLVGPQEPLLISSSPSPPRSPSFSPTPSKPPYLLPRAVKSQSIAPPRFHFRTPTKSRSSVIPSSTSLPHPTRPPTFILPSAPHNQHSTPDPSTLPIIFSPHRKGQRFVPGGMAATARDWIVGISGPQGRVEREAERYVVKVCVSETREGGKGWLMVAGHRADGNRQFQGGKMKGDRGSDSVDAEIETDGTMVLSDEALEFENWIFVGTGTSEAGGRYVSDENMPKTGLLIGIREPVWDIDTRGNKWRICIWWDIIEDG